MAKPLLTLFREASERTLLERLGQARTRGHENRQYQGENWVERYDPAAGNMNAGVLAYAVLKRFGLEERGTPDVFDEVWARDLVAIMGAPAKVEVAKHIRETKQDAETEATGEYLPQSNSIVIKENVYHTDSLREVLTHEFVHLWQAHHGDFINHVWDDYKISPPEDSSYALHSRVEHQAVVIAAAIMLCELVGMPNVSATKKRRIIQRMDKKYPGVQIWVRLFVGHPVFKPRLEAYARRANIHPLEPSLSWPDPVWVHPGVRHTFLHTCNMGGASYLVGSGAARGLRRLAKPNSDEERREAQEFSDRLGRVREGKNPEIPVLVREPRAVPDGPKRLL